jgi:hypothetical protein
MSACGGNLADWWGWLAGATGIVGSLLLVRPLFLLLQQREALEAIGYALDLDLLKPDLHADVKEARRIFATEIYRRRHRWKAWVYAGIGFLVVAGVGACLQLLCLIAAGGG